MATPTPPRLSPAKLREKKGRLTKIAKQLGFSGEVVYCHVYSQTGGAQYGWGRTPKEDLLIVYAEAFDRDADPDDFSLEAILAHERGHQILARHPRIAKRVKGKGIVMMGPKKLSTIRQELEKAMGASSQDPIEWLEERMSAPVPPNGEGQGENAVLQSLRRFCEGAKKKRPKGKRAETYP